MDTTLRMSRRLVAVVCVAVVGCGGAQTSSTAVSGERASEDATAEDASGVDSTSAADAVDSPEKATASLTECVWAQRGPNDLGSRESTLLFDGNRYVHTRSGKPCDTVTVYIGTVEQLGPGLAAFDDTTRVLGADHVAIEVGTAVTVYASREEVLADPDAGAPAAAVIPKKFDFEQMSLARYDVLHSRRVSCRDGMLGLTGAQAKALHRQAVKWQKRRERLATKWRFVSGAAAVIHDIEVLDPVLPAERTSPPDGPCKEAWITQPALTEVPREVAVRLLSR